MIKDNSARKKTIGLIYGGTSAEHDISVLSSQFIYTTLKKNKNVIVTCIFVAKDGKFYVGDTPDALTLANSFCEALKGIDVVFPALHGPYGEDGKIQGMLEVLDISYMGSGVTSSAICMDKVYAKTILKANNIKTASAIVVTADSQNDVLVKAFPVFVKPANQGSSIGAHRVNDASELHDAIKDALRYDAKVLIEEYVDGREIECAVYEKDGEVFACTPGEIESNSSDGFYSYDAKYSSNSLSKITIPATLPGVMLDEIRKTAKDVFRIMGCKHLARVDFFVTKNNEIVINEVNTMPGFTSISMYPMMLEHDGVSIEALIASWIEN